MKQLKAHTSSFNAVSPQMYSVGCVRPPQTPIMRGSGFYAWRRAVLKAGCDLQDAGSGTAHCAPILISDSSDPGITPDPALATRFHSLGPHVEYWPTLSSPDWMSGDGGEDCKPPLCYNGTGSPVARCPCGQAPNETTTMKVLLEHPESLIASAIAQAKKWNITGYVRPIPQATLSLFCLPTPSQLSCSRLFVPVLCQPLPSICFHDARS